MPEEPLGKRIRAAREKRRWSRARLAEKLNVSTETVLRWELQGVLPRPSAQKDLSDLFGFQEEDFQQEKKGKETTLRSAPNATGRADLEKRSNDDNVSQNVEIQTGPSTDTAGSTIETEKQIAASVSIERAELPDAERKEKETPEATIEVGSSAGMATSLAGSEAQTPEVQSVECVESHDAATREKKIPESDIELVLPPKEDFKLYRGWRTERHQGHGIVKRIPYVTVNGRVLPYFGPKTVDPEQQRVYEWGYHGEGPRHLAESILANFFGETYPAQGYASRENYRAFLYEYAFKCEVVAFFSRKEDAEWNLTSYQIRNWLLSLKERGITEKDLLEKSFHYDSETGLVKVDEEVTR